MCGIAGIIGLGSSEQGKSTVEQMVESIHHRGPDDQVSFATPGFAFGMCRLSIIDLAEGRQPIWTERGTGIVFNGEIYNYREQREWLEARGHRFRTHSDTEVVVRLYDELGPSFVERLDGMFAICLYDPGKRQVLLLRDRLGKKPLYYAQVNGVFYFASEAKAILAALPSKPALVRQSLHDYLTLRYVPGPDTVWQGIKKLEPSHRLTLSLENGTHALERYWSVDFVSAPVVPDRDYVQEFERLFLDAVQKRLLAADVPVGILLSGGIDSSAVAAAAVELGHKAFHTFSVAFDAGGEFDERDFARSVAGHLGSRHEEIVIGEREFLDFLPSLVRATDEPLADLAAIPHHFVSSLARKSVKVVLSGEGADEVLAGYDFERLARALDRMRQIDRIAPRWLMAVAGRIVPPVRGELLTLARAGWSGFLRDRATHMTRVWTEAEKTRLWPPGSAMRPTAELIRSWYDAAPSSHPIDQMQQVYCHSWLVEDLLMKADKMSMAASLELRCPFLDHRLVEWAARLPMDWKVGNDRVGYSSKRILREFARKRLPAAIVSRPKRGFPVPAYGWLAGKTGQWAESRLGQQGCLGRLFDTSTVAPVLSAARAGDTTAAHKIWTLLVLDQWIEALDVTAIFVSWSYPPMRLPRAIQVERLVRHLAHARPDAVVCGVAGGGPGAGFEPEAIPPVIRVSSSPLTRLVERKTASARVRARVQSLDTDFYWWRAAAARIERQWTLGPGDLLVTFGQPWAGHRAGLRVKRRSGAKWIAHFSDPWADSPFLTEHRARQKALRHEAEVIEAADMVIFTSDETLDLVMAKYPSEWHAKAAVLPHAFEPDLYPAAEAHDGPMMIRYLGNFYGARGPEPLFHALSILGQTQPDLLAQIRVELVGDTPVRFLNSDYLRALPSETVRIIPSVGYRQSLALMQSADLLLNIDAPFERSVFLPSKLVDYIGAGRPIFGITPPGTAARLIQYLGGWVVEPGQPDRVANALETALISVAQNRTAPWGNAAIRSTFSAPVVARQFESLMKRVHAAQ